MWLGRKSWMTGRSYSFLARGRESSLFPIGAGMAVVALAFLPPPDSTLRTALSPVALLGLIAMVLGLFGLIFWVPSWARSGRGAK